MSLAAVAAVPAPLTPVRVTAGAVSGFDRVDANARAAFARDGVVQLRGLVAADLRERYAAALHRFVALQLDLAGAGPAEPDLDAAYNHLCTVDRGRSGAVYEAARRAAAFFAIMTAPAVLDAVGALLEDPTVLLPPNHAFLRIDRAGETRFAFPWHQDYPFNLMSRPTITLWTPLRPIDAEMGRLRIIPGSHDRLHRLDVTADERFVTFADLADAELDPLAVEAEVPPGDALLFHERLLHRSGVNTTPRARWTLNGRYGSASDPMFAARGWRDRQDTGFRETRDLHPELF